MLKRFTLLFYILFSFIPLALPANQSTTQILSDAWFIESSSTAIPEFDNTQWQAVSLPDYWDVNHRDYDSTVWYRLQFNNTLAYEQPAFYLPKAAQSYQIYINNTLLGDTGRVEKPYSRNWLRPYLFTVPKPLLNEGVNTIHIRLSANVNDNGMLDVIEFGDKVVLEPDYNARFHFHITSSQVATVLLIFITFIAVFLWRVGNDDAPMLYVGLASIMSAIYTVTWWMQDVPLSRPVWDAIWYSAIGWYVFFLLMFLNRLLGLRLKSFELPYFAFTALGMVSVFCVPEPILTLVAMSFRVGDLIMASIILTCMILDARPDTKMDVIVLFPCFSVSALLALHDSYNHALEPPLDNIYGFHLSGLLVLLVIMWVIVSRHIRNARELKILTDELENRVQDKTKALEKSHEQILSLEKLKATHTERQRIMLDLHDGIGGHLISAISLTEIEHGNDNALHQTLTLAMQDLRIIIDTMDSDESDLITVLAMFRQRMEPILKGQNIDLIWDVKEEPVITDFNPSKSLQVMRIVQEAVTNVIKHAQASNITMTVTKQSIQIQDNGTGLLDKDTNGHGLDSMRSRAKRLDAQIHIDSNNTGLSVVLHW